MYWKCTKNPESTLWGAERCFSYLYWLLNSYEIWLSEWYVIFSSNAVSSAPLKDALQPLVGHLLFSVFAKMYWECTKNRGCTVFRDLRSLPHRSKVPSTYVGGFFHIRFFVICYAQGKGSGSRPKGYNGHFRLVKHRITIWYNDNYDYFYGMRFIKVVICQK